MNTTIVGTGYVGLTTGALLACAGHKVYCLDIDKEKLDVIRSGRSYFYEPGLDTFVKEGIETGNLIPTDSYQDSIPNSEIAIISVGTPSKEDGSTDLSYIESAFDSIAQHMNENLIIVQKSTVPVGTGENMIQRVKEKSNKNFELVSCPEFLSEGTAVFDTLNIDRFVVGGKSDVAKKKVISLFKSIDDLAKETDLDQLSEFSSIYRNKVEKYIDKDFAERVISMDLESAEMVKVTANSFLAMKISFANSIARICDLTGADVTKVMEAVGEDERIGKSFLYAGLGWGGGCFPKDVSGLYQFAEQKGFDFGLLKQTQKVNAQQVRFASKKVEDIISQNNIEDPVVGILGLAFKPGTSDVRESQSIKLANKLAKQDYQVRVSDPQSIEESRGKLDPKISIYDKVEDLIYGVDILILGTDWPVYTNLDFEKYQDKFRNKYLIDGRNRWDKTKLKKLGFVYKGVGK